MTDPIADLLTRIRNASRARHHTVSIPASKLKESIIKILKDEGYLSDYVKEELKPQSKIKIFLKYDAEKKPLMRQIDRVSRPGGRVYKGYKEVRPYLRGIGVTILSTPQGVMTDRAARKAKVGGEILCKVW